MSDGPFESVAILGLGAMGGSLARALAALETAPRVTGWSPNAEERRAALEAGVLAAAPDAWPDAVTGAELVVLAAPLNACCELVGPVLTTTDDATTVTDVASLKIPLARAASAVGGAERWVGSHPMTGSEEYGFGASRRELYEGARVWTVVAGAEPDRVARVEAMWISVGAQPEPVDAEEHDRLMALASQLPQLVSNALATVLAEGGVPRDRLGPGGRDMTRLAASGSAMWRDILEHADPALIRGLRAASVATARFAELLEGGDLDRIQELMLETRTWSRGT